MRSAGGKGGPAGVARAIAKGWRIENCAGSDRRDERGACGHIRVQANAVPFAARKAAVDFESDHLALSLALRRKKRMHCAGIQGTPVPRETGGGVQAVLGVLVEAKSVVGGESKTAGRKNVLQNRDVGLLRECRGVFLGEPKRKRIAKAHHEPESLAGINGEDVGKRPQSVCRG